LVAGPGIEPGTGAYETPVLPLHYPAIYLTLRNRLKDGYGVSCAATQIAYFQLAGQYIR
jgi:hypothetical protein